MRRPHFLEVRGMVPCGKLGSFLIGARDKLALGPHIRLNTPVRGLGGPARFTAYPPRRAASPRTLVGWLVRFGRVEQHVTRRPASRFDAVDLIGQHQPALRQF